MTADLSSVAREAAQPIAERIFVPLDRPTSVTDLVAVQSFIDGFTECASRLPSEEELAEAMFVAYADETGKPFAEEWHGIRSLYLEQARAVLALIGEKISG